MVDTDNKPPRSTYYLLFPLGFKSADTDEDDLTKPTGAMSFGKSTRCVSPDIIDALSNIDIASMAKIIAEAAKNERNHKKLTGEEIEGLEKENEKIKKKLEDDCPGSNIFGKNDGSDDKYYDESEISYTDDISKIHIKSDDDFVHSIQIEYMFGSKTACHGGKGGRLKTLVLDSDEKIIGVDVSMFEDIVSGLTFYTNAGEEKKFGKISGEDRVQSYELYDGQYLAGIKGYDNDNGEATGLPAIGFTAKV